MYKIPIIVPVFNVEDTLQNAFDSIKAQTIGFENLEVIFVDDNSTDDSVNIIKNYSNKYGNVKVICLDENSGFAGRPRNIGIENAKPEDIRDALSKARATVAQKNHTFSQSDLFELGLAGGENAAELRNRIGRILGIGYGNTKLFLRRLNEYGITREELKDAWTSCTQMQPSEE